MDALDRITERILAKMEKPDLIDDLRRLPATDLTSLLLAVFDARAEDMTPAKLLAQYEKSRFTRASSVDPVVYHALAARLLAAAREDGFSPFMLSPSASFGSCSALAPVDQKKVLSSVRGTETLSDPTNMLALHIAGTIKQEKPDRTAPLHYCCASRVTRGQAFAESRMLTHFGIFGLVSSGLDTQGSFTCECALLEAQLGLIIRLLGALTKAKKSITFRPRGGYHNAAGLLDAAGKRLNALHPHVEIGTEDLAADNSYYIGLNFKVNVCIDGEEVSLGDGGFVDWTQKLLNNRKERLLISGFGIERLLDIAQDVG